MRTETETFLTLLEQGRVTADQIDDFVEAWHESGDEETRSLAEFLGMTDEEYGVSLMARRSLPVIMQARREGRPLRVLLVPYLASLVKANDPMERTAIYSLTHWLNKPDPT